MRTYRDRMRTYKVLIVSLDAEPYSRSLDVQADNVDHAVEQGVDMCIADEDVIAAWADPVINCMEARDSWVNTDWPTR